MSQQISFNGQIYTIPDTSDEGWGQNVTSYLLAIPQGALQKVGGNFTLTGNVNFGPNFGLLVKFLSSRDAGAAAAGLVRLAKLDQISWRNNAGSADLALGIDGSDNLTFNGVILQPAGNYITALTGDVVATGPGSAAATIQSDVIVDAMVKSNAAIARSKLANGTADHVLINNPSGGMSSEAQLAISRGGTGQATAQAALDALLPTQTSQSGKFLTTNGTTSSWGSVPGAKTSSYELFNLGLATSVAANALTIALKQADGSTDPTTGAGSVDIGFRSATSANGNYNERSVTSALSLVISSGSTLGTLNGVAAYLWVYALDNAGTVELAVSQTKYDEGSIVSTTAEGGAGAADSATAIYSTTARSNVPIRLIARLLSTQTTAGTWATAPTEVSLSPAVLTPIFLAPITQVITSNTTYNLPTLGGRRPTYIEVEAVGGGGGGAGSGSTLAVAASAGTATTFGSILTCNGGGGGAGGNSTGGVGGTNSITTSATVIEIDNVAGSDGGPGQYQKSDSTGGNGGPSYFGGAGQGGLGSLSSNTAAKANSGSGGGGSGFSGTGNTGAGGGAGGYSKIRITAPLSSYSVTVGAGGSAGGTGSGGAQGKVIVTAYFT